MLFSNIKSIYISNKTLKELKINGQKVWTAEEPDAPEEDELQGLWHLNDIITYSPLPYGDLYAPFKFKLHFKSNGLEFDTLTIATTAGWISYDFMGGENYIKFKMEEVQNFPNERYLNITSKLANVTDGKRLLEWLKANGQKVEEPLKGT